MKKAVFLVILLIAIKSYAAEPEIREVKNLFSASAYSKASADQLLKLLSATGESSPALFICYKGAAEMMQAKYGFNPVNKFKRFKKGRSLIENAVKKRARQSGNQILKIPYPNQSPFFSQL